jgi:hypothetical protein
MITTNRADLPTVNAIFALHGIHTHAGWQRAFFQVADSHGWRPRLDRWNFGYFSVFRFILPWQRQAKVRWFRTTYRDELHDTEVGLRSTDFPSIVAHSFGTYILGNALLKYDYLRFNKVILCGSILPKEFPWDEIINRGQVQAVRNEFGVQDIWSRLVDRFIPGTGPSGCLGFSRCHERLEQERFYYSHSEYFDKAHMEAKWIPFLSQQLAPIPSAKSPIALPCSRRPWGLYFAYVTAILLSVISTSALSAQSGTCQRHGVIKVLARYVGSPAPTGLVAWWPGDGNARDALGVNHGVSAGHATYGPGSHGSAFRIVERSGDLFEFPVANLPTGDTDRTMAFWVRVTFTPERGQSTLAGYGQFGSEMHAYELGLLNKRLYFSNWGDSLATDYAVLTESEWHHIAVTNTGRMIRLYLDGREIKNGQLQSSINTMDSTRFYLGGLPGLHGSSRQFQGLIDDVRIYNRALTATEIRSVCSE